MKNKPKLYKILEKQTDMPLVSVSSLPLIEITGRNLVEIDGIKSIIKSDKNEIKLKLNQFNVLINGNELHFRNFSEKSAIIEGNIDSMYFE